MGFDRSDSSSSTSARGTRCIDGRELWRDKRLEMSKRIKEEHSQRVKDAVATKHERAEILRKKRENDTLSPNGSFHEPVQSTAFVSGRVAPTRAFGEPVRGINFCQICNVRDAAPVCFPMYEVQLDNHGELLPQGFFGKAKSKQAQAHRSPPTTQNGLRRYNEAYPSDMLIDPATSSSISLGVGFIGSEDPREYSRSARLPSHTLTGGKLLAEPLINRMTISCAPSGFGPQSIPEAITRASRFEAPEGVTRFDRGPTAVTAASHRSNWRFGTAAAPRPAQLTSPHPSYSTSSFPPVGKGGLSPRSPRHRNPVMALERSGMFLGKERSWIE